MTYGDAVDRAYWSEEQQQNVMLNEKRNWALPPTRALSNSLREKSPSRWEVFRRQSNVHIAGKVTTPASVKRKLS